MIDQLRRDAQSLRGELVAWRRDFHRHPEIAFEERRTSSVIAKFFENLGLPARPAGGTGLVARLEGKPGGKTVCLRADMDALPLKEEGDKDYISENPDACHACGHDGHMAILMGVAKLLSERKEEFRGKVVFLFQPAEERIPGGAKRMIEEGALQGVDAIFGLHLWQPLPTGKIGIVKGAMMAAPDEFSVTVIGKGGHGSMPQTTIDPILVASQLVINLQSIVSRNVDPLKSAVVSLGTIQGGTIFNIIPCEVKLTGTVRTFDPELRQFMEKRVREVVQGTCQTFGAKGEINYIRGYPALINDASMTELVKEVARNSLGENCLREIDPVMGGEDFAYYLQCIPGAFLFFGMGDGMIYPHHHPGFDLDEKSLPLATLFMSSLALDYLKRNA